MALRDNMKSNADKKKQETQKALEEASKVEVAYDEYGDIDTEKTQKNLRASVRKTTEAYNKDKPKREHFRYIKMWVNYLVSLTMKDRGKIPDNIGDRILITNNQYITKLYMSTIIQIYELGTNTPVTLMSCLNALLRDKGNKAVLDATFKNSKYDYDPTNSGLKSRINVWENNLDNPAVSRKMRERSARCLYTVEVAKSGKLLKNTRMYLTVRAKDVRTLNNAEKIIFDGLGTMGCSYMPAHGSIKQQLEYISLFGGKNEDLKGTVPVMTSNVVLSQIVPNCGSLNDRQGYYIGQNVINGTPYYIDFASITVARNLYCVAPSGVGKTVIALNMAQSAYENGAACVFMDIKGNEYTNFINATNGYIVSLRPNSIEYINSFVMHKDDVTGGNPESYFKSRVNFSKQQMIILSGISDREELLEFEELLDEFLDTLYVTVGAIPTNVNSWDRTLDLTPYEVFERFERYLTPQKRAQYNLHKSVMGTLRMYYSPTGSKSYVFKREFDYASIMASDTLSFDFGILSTTNSSDVDQDLFRLKFLYMSKLNGEFTTNQYAKGRRTFKVLEESQVVSDDIMRMYVQEYTLRRAQQQDTLLLGNSVQALQSNVMSKPLIENTTGLLVGQLTQDARRVVIEQFGLQYLEDRLKVPGSSARYKNCFVFINNMQDKQLYPILQVQIEKDENDKPKRYKINTPVKESNAMSGS